MNKKERMAAFANDVYSIEITGRNINVTQPLKDYAIEKISKIDRFTDRIIDVHVIMDVQKLNHRCEIVLRVNNLKIRSQADSTDMYASIDEAVKKMESQLKKYLSKLHNHFSNIKEERKMQIDVISPITDEDIVYSINEQNALNRDKALLETFKPHKVMKQKSKPLKLLTVEEAVIKMDLSLDHFLIFRNEKTRHLQVIYRRKDDNYGIMSLEG